MSSTRRLERILAIEKESQSLWDENKAFEVEAESLAQKQNAFFITFPYAYMNGRLHLGHAFSVSKSEFRARFERLNNRHVLWCFAFHCTGMPIAASADKIRNELRELEDPSSKLQLAEEVAAAAADDELNAVTVAGQAKVYTGRKSKVAQKGGNAKGQMGILRSMGVPEEEIPKFADARYWLEYFPPLGKKDARLIGLGVDWRRSFITTNYNPYYDAFISWQFNLLKERQRLKFGLRPAVYSRVEDQPCADHDRAAGEGVNPIALNILKLEVVEASPKLTELVSNSGSSKQLRASILALTAPQCATILGKPHFFLNPETEFGVYLALPKRLEASDLATSSDETFVARKRCTKAEALEICEEILICERHCAENMEYQGLLPSNPETLEPYTLGTLSAEDVKSLVVRLNSTSLTNLPPTLTGQFVTTGKIEKGPRINVTSGPAVKNESPDAALKALEALKAEGLCIQVYEPEKPVISRSGAECVVALCNQWYQDFGNREWKDIVLSHVRDPEAFDPYGQMATYERSVEWFDGWACSRNYGLGTYLPWELERGNKIVIESLSDSTIYWAYYTIAHFFQGDMYGTKPGRANLKAEELTMDVLNYIFCQTDVIPPCSCGEEVLKEMRNSFEYWYPMDLRCSGKDLMGNHLTMALFNHAAIWPNRRDLWPRAYYANGFVCVDSKKMSKSEGNFLTVEECTAKFGADATRLACADAGDSAEEANFEQSTAVAGLMKLYNFQKDVEEFFQKKSLPAEECPYRTGEKTDVDLMFEYECELLSLKARQAFASMLMRDANKYAFYEQLTLRDWYKNILADQKRELHAESYKFWIRLTTITESPITPHTMEYIWSKILNEPTLLSIGSQWPECKYHIVHKNPERLQDPIAISPNKLGGGLHLRYMMLTQLGEDVRKQVEKARKGDSSKTVTIRVHCARTLPPLKCAVLQQLRQIDLKELSGKSWVGKLKSSEALASCKGKELAMLMGFASYRAKLIGELGAEVALAETLPFDELVFWEGFKHFMNTSCSADFVFDDQGSAAAAPGAPVFEIQI